MGRHRTMWNLTCESCGQKFIATRNDAKHCSPKCRKKASRQKKKLEDNFRSILWWIDQLEEDQLRLLKTKIEARLS